ncbi:MAG: Gfo/Idh/MocA family oxidoreductase [Candidatus Hydrogenedentes bacterium]|nr:Gfo/Idh/MocA family oxidoreductase [Candidatus Hydrogenedentota bacterium]
MLRVGILGAGHFATRHLAALERLHGRIQLVCVGREHPERPFPPAEALGVPVLAPDAVIASPDVDAVCVCAPNHRHRSLAEAALGAGKHVFCEKPLVLTVADADALIRASTEANRVLMAGHLTRYTPIYTAAAAALAAGRIGKPVAVQAARLQVRGDDASWRMDGHAGGGAPFDLLIHDFDLLNWFLGPPECVFARGRRHARGAYDSMTAVFSYAGRVTAGVYGGFVLQPPAPFRAQFRVIGERGHIGIDTADTEHPVRVLEAGREEEAVPLEPPAPGLEGVAGEWGEFADTVEGRGAGRLRLGDARQAVACAALAVRSADEAVELRFP